MNILIFVLVLVAVVLFFAFQEKIVNLPPFKTIGKHPSFYERLIPTIVGVLLLSVSLVPTLLYLPKAPRWVISSSVVFFTILTAWTLYAWWMPYIFGRPDTDKEELKKSEFSHRFFPARGDAVFLNAMQVTLHLFIWSGCLFSWYLWYHV